MNILESPIWQGISGLLALAAIIVSVVIYRLQTQKRLFAYQIISDSPILAEPKMLNGRVTILMGDVKVKALRFVAVRFQNIGRAALQKNEFDGPIRLRFSEKSDVLVASSAEVDPQNLPLEITSTNQSIEISPLLLNPGDSFAVHCVLSNPLAGLSVDARIAGIRAITKLDVDEQGRSRSMPARTLKKFQEVFVAMALAAAVSGSYESFRKGLETLLVHVQSILR